ncbi:UNVERIFIED_CONTAM: Regulator of nonsense transcripts UPF3 [Sesamum latifolium]|uniref:Regulator of nonsense transcripts UPF3 n=1 Tax=Sesamum latifolium TaxID=2727402 RepID=A0AAW2V0Y2_9LAMI
MKGPLDRTKVVLRHLPPTISQSNLVEHVDSRFAGRYRWLAFRPGKSSLKHPKYSRAYIDFNKPEDVIEFAEFFNGHVFVNEKGTQFKTIVEYAPSQRVPKQWSKKDGRESTILKDPEYLEFLEFLAKPIENLPSAEIQLERKEAERAGAPKDVPIVTPLMDYVRQRRAAKGGARRSMLNGKQARRGSGVSSRNPVSGSSKRGSDKRRASTTMYVLRDSSKIVSSIDSSSNSLVPKQDDQQLVDKSGSAAMSRNVSSEGESGVSGFTETGKKKILLLKGKKRKFLIDEHMGKEFNTLNARTELCGVVSGGSFLQQNAAAPAKTSQTSALPKQNQQREGSGRIIRSILLNRDTRQNQPSSRSQLELRIQGSNQDRDKKPPRPPTVQLSQKDTNGPSEDKVVPNDLPAVHMEKQERRTRNKDRPDRGVWTPLRRSDGSHPSDESLSSASQALDSAEGNHVEKKHEMLVTVVVNTDPVEVVVAVITLLTMVVLPSLFGTRINSMILCRRNLHSDGLWTSIGSYRHGGRRGSAYNVKDADVSSNVEGKSLKRGGSSGYGSHEVWSRPIGREVQVNVHERQPLFFRFLLAILICEMLWTVTILKHTSGVLLPEKYPALAGLWRQTMRAWETVEARKFCLNATATIYVLSSGLHLLAEIYKLCRPRIAPGSTVIGFVEESGSKLPSSLVVSVLAV